MCLTLDEALKFGAHPKAQIRTAVRAVPISSCGDSGVSTITAPGAHCWDALFEGILHEVAAKRYDDGYLIVDVKRRMRVWRRVEYFNDKGSGVSRPSLRPGRFVMHRVHFIQDTMSVAWLQ